MALNYNMSSWVDDVGGVGVEGIRFLMLPSRRVTCGIEFLCSFKRVLTWFMTFIHLFLSYTFKYGHLKIIEYQILKFYIFNQFLI